MWALALRGLLLSVIAGVRHSYCGFRRDLFLVWFVSREVVLPEILRQSEVDFEVCRLAKFSVVILYSKFLFRHNRRLPSGVCVCFEQLALEGEVQYGACGLLYLITYSMAQSPS